MRSVKQWSDACGCVARRRVRVIDLGTVRDDEAELEQVLRSAAADYDVVNQVVVCR